MPYIKKIAKGGLDFVFKDEELITGLNIYNGKIVYKKIAEDLFMLEKYSEPIIGVS